MFLGYLNDIFLCFKFKKIIKIVNDSTTKIKQRVYRSAFRTHFLSGDKKPNLVSNRYQYFL